MWRELGIKDNEIDLASIAECTHSRGAGVLYAAILLHKRDCSSSSEITVERMAGAVWGKYLFEGVRSNESKSRQSEAME